MTHRRSGFVLLPVVLLLALVAVVAFMMNNESGLDSDVTASQADATRADLVARAGLEHAEWAVQNSSCAGDLAMTTVPFGQGNYTATVDAGGATTTSYTFTPDRDSFIEEGHPDSNKGDNDTLDVKNKPGDRQHALYHYDLSSIPTDRRVVTATAWFYINSEDVEDEVTLHPVTADWSEAGATWNTIGGKFDSGAYGSFPPQPDKDVWVSVNVTALAQNWVSNPGSNYGFLLNATSDNVESIYTSREYGTASLRPYLEVTTADAAVSPVAISASGTLTGNPGPAGDINRTLTRTNVPAYQPGSYTRLQPGAVEGEDAEIWDQAPNNNYGNVAETWVSSASSDTTRSLLRFNTDVVPPGARILEATLSLERRSGSGADQPVSAHRITNDWKEGEATWNVRKTGQPWDVAGADFDSSAVATTPVGPANQRYAWDITPLVQGWADGSYPNYGIALVAAIAGMPGERFYTSDDTDPTVRPSLGITYTCECGSPCLMPQGNGTVMMVVINPTTLVPADAYKKALFESWGYTVNVIGENANAAAYMANAASTDVFYISETVNSNQVGSRIKDVPIGVISEDGDYNGDLGFAGDSAYSVGAAINVTDTSHYITAVFPTGSLDIYAAGMEQLTVSGTEAAGLQTLADTGGAGSLVVLDKGALDTGGTPLAGRRVMLPLGRVGKFNWDYLNGNGRLLVQRALQWGMGVASAATGPFAHWKLDETIGNTAVDSVGGHDGTLTNGPAWTTGQDNGALDFDGTNDYVDLGSDTELEDIFDGGATVTAWIYPRSWGESDNGRILDKASQVSGDRDGWMIGVVGTTPALQFAQGFTGVRGYWRSQAGTVSLNEWVHVAVVYDASSVANDASIYLDGVKQSSLVEITPTGTIATDAGIPLRMGNYAQDTTRTFDGMIDDARIYKRMLSDAEIAELAAPSSTGPIAHWKLDETTGTTAVDSAGGHDGDLVNGPAWTTGQDGGALDLDGTNDFVNIPHDDTLSLTETMTFAAWINPDSIGGSYNTVLAKDGGGSGSNYFFGIWQDEIVFGFFAGGSFREVFTNGLNIQAGSWQHIAASFDNSANRVILYLDGVAVHKGEMTYSPTAVTADLTIGRTPDGERWRGLLDDVRIYDTELSEAEIADIASGGSGGGGGPPPSVCDGTFRDEFNTQSFDGNDGTLPWAGSWQEIGESDGPASNKDIGVYTDQSNYQLRIQDNDNGGEGVARAADLTGAASAILSFQYRRDSLDNSNDYVTVSVSTTGTSGPWTELTRFTGLATDSNYIGDTLDLTPYISATTAIRFLSSPTLGGGDRVWFDDIEITCSP